MAEKDEDLKIRRDAKIIKYLLRSIGIEEYEPCVVNRILELWYKYAGDVLTEHTGMGLIDSDDIKLAIQSKVNFTFSRPPPRGVLLELAENRNKIPSPPEQWQDPAPSSHLNSREAIVEQDEAAKLNPSLEQSIESVQHTHRRVSLPLSKQTN